jgi:hypothetical protein
MQQLTLGPRGVDTARSDWSVTSGRSGAVFQRLRHGQHRWICSFRTWVVAALVRGRDSLSRTCKMSHSRQSNVSGRRWTLMRLRKCGKSMGAMSFSCVAMSQGCTSRDSCPRSAWGHRAPTTRSGCRCRCGRGLRPPAWRQSGPCSACWHPSPLVDEGD